MRELLDEGGQVHVVGRRRLHAAQPPRDAAQRPQVDVDDLLDPRPLDLDDDVGQAGVGGVGIRERAR